MAQGSSWDGRATLKQVSSCEEAVVASCSPPKMAVSSMRVDGDAARDEHLEQLEVALTSQLAQLAGRRDLVHPRRAAVRLEGQSDLDVPLAQGVAQRRAWVL